MLRIYRPIPVEKLKLLVFDLDGTLIDSARDLCASVNATLAYAGRKSLPESLIAGFVGNGAPTLMRRALARSLKVPLEQVDEDLQRKCFAFFLSYYREHKLDFTRVYEGVLDSLKALRNLHDEHGGNPWVMAVLTNKPVRPARGICEGLGMADYFLHIYGGNSFKTKKPEPEGMFLLMNEVGARPDETVMIGDSSIDVQTARNAGSWCIGCTFGYGPESLVDSHPDILVDTPAEWTEALGVRAK
jgi:phosphoglycolate phosphatase